MCDVELPNSPKRSIFNQKIYTLDEIVWLFNHVQPGRSHYGIDVQSRVLTKYFGTTNVDDAWRIAGGSSNLIFECEPNNNDELNARVFVLKENNIWYRENPSNYEIFNKEYQLTLHKVHYKYNVKRIGLYAIRIKRV